MPAPGSERRGATTRGGKITLGHGARGITAAMTRLSARPHTCAALPIVIRWKCTQQLHGLTCSRLQWVNNLADKQDGQLTVYQPGYTCALAGLCVTPLAAHASRETKVPPSISSVGITMAVASCFTIVL